MNGGPDSTFESRNIVLKSWLPLNSFDGYPGAGANGSDCWGYTSPSGREYALMGLNWGNGIVEVTDPLNPDIVATVPGGVNSLWRDLTVIGNYAYAVSDSVGVGIQVIDLSQIDAGAVTLVRNYSQGGHATSHTLLSNPASGFLYSCGGNIAGGGIMPCATTPDPTFPTFAGTGWTGHYVHEALIETYTTGPYAGREIAFLFTGGHGIVIVDFTVKSSPTVLSTITYPARSYSHQGWLSPDKRFLYHNDEDSNQVTRVFDVSDLSAPRLVSAFTKGLGSIDHNEYTKGRYLYQSNYTTGLRVWDLANPLVPVEVAFIDTRPESNDSGYSGSWGNYPFFNSGTVLISDMNRGLFMVRLSVLELSPAGVEPTALVPGQPTPISINVTEREAVAASVQLMVSVNEGAYAPYPMTLQGGVYSGELPGLTAADRVRYYFLAETDDTPPRQFTWPVGAGVSTLVSVEGNPVVVFEDTFEIDRGWTVQNGSGLTSGAWERATPLYNGGAGAVIGDADGSGRCFVTGNTFDVDVDGGSTTLLSPVLDLSRFPETRIEYHRWLLSVGGAVDSLTTEISNNNGASWVPVHTISRATGAWNRTQFRVADFVAPTAQVRVRFRVADTDASTTEAGIDGFRVVSPVPGTCYANCDGSVFAPILTVNDYVCFLNRFSVGDPYANCDGSTAVPTLNVVDFMCFSNQFATGCP